MPANPARDHPDVSPRRRRFLPVWAGMDLGTWLRLLALRPPLHPSRAGRIAGVTVASCVNSLLNAAEAAAYGRRAARTAIDRPPLFILGHWRSGTTLLHNLLARDPQFVAPSSYQVAFPGHFLLTERWATRITRGLLPSRRPMDEMSFSWDLPGEDEIALLVTTLLSPYLRVAFPAGGATVDRLDDLRRNLTPAEAARWKAALLTFLSKVTHRAPKTLLLKSPAHTGRIPLLLELFPDARFVYVVRNPYDVFPSTRHLQRVLFEMNGLGRREPPDLDERILVTYSRLYEAYHLHRALVRPNRRIELRFEDLEADVAGTLGRVYEHLGLAGFDRFRTALEAELPSVRGHRKNRYEIDEATRRTIYERWRPAFARYGYPP